MIFVTVLVAGLCYGILGWATVQYVTGIKCAILSMIILSVSAGYVPSYSQSLSCSKAVLLTSISPWIVGCLVKGESEYYVMGGLLAFYLFANIRRVQSWYDHSDHIKKLNSLLLDKEDKLVDALTAAGAIGWDWDIASDRIELEGDVSGVFGESRGSTRITRGQFVELFDPADREALREAMNLAPQYGFEVECRATWTDGSSHYINVRGRTVLDDSGLPSRVRGTCWDLTAKREQERVRYERDLFEAANNAKLLFLANASHEIRTPLAAIHGHAEMVLNQNEMPKTAQFDLMAILRNCKYMVSLVNDLLDLSKAETDNLYIQPSRISVVQELNDAVLPVRSAALRKGLSLEVEYSGLIPETIYSDATRLRQIVINLLSNSVKYTNNGGVRVKVSFVDDLEPRIVIRVQDTGVGIDKDSRKTLFQPFSRGMGLANQRVPGSGLGLALSRGLARKLGGDLKLIENAAGVTGTTFEFTLPVSKISDTKLIDASQAGLFPSQDLLKNETSLFFRGLKILVVDDDEDLRDLTVRLLQTRGATTSTSENGKEAVSQALSTPFDAILMDVKMPVMDGYEATAELRKAGYQRPIIALTAHASLHDRQACLQAGFNRYISKPVNMRELVEVIGHEVSALRSVTEDSSKSS